MGFLILLYGIMLTLKITFIFKRKYLFKSKEKQKHITNLLGIYYNIMPIYYTWVYKVVKVN